MVGEWAGDTGSPPLTAIKILQHICLQLSLPACLSLANPWQKLNVLGHLDMDGNPAEVETTRRDGIVS